MVVLICRLVYYNNKRILCANFTDNQSNPDTYAFRHYSLGTVRMLEPDQTPAGKKIVVVVYKVELWNVGQLAQKHAKFVMKVCALRSYRSHDGDFDNELYYNQLLVAEQEVVARPGCAIRIGYVIKQIIACDYLQLPVMPPAWMPAPPTQLRARPSRQYAYMPPICRQMDSSN